MTRDRLRALSARTLVTAIAIWAVMLLIAAWFGIGAHDYPGSALLLLGWFGSLLIAAVAVLLFLASFFIRR